MNGPDQSGTHVTFFRDAEVGHIEARSSRRTGLSFKKHFHETYSIGIVEQGANSFFHRNADALIGAGTVVLINPGEVHACNPRPDVLWAYKMFYVDIDLMREVAADVFESNGEAPVFTKASVRDAALFSALADLYRVLLNSGDALEKDVRMHDAFSRLILEHADRGAPRRSPGKAERATTRACDYIMEHLGRNISLAELSSAAELSAFHLVRIFRRRFGLPPHAFQLQQRINSAKRMLARNIPVVQVAFALGFADQSHFAKRFKAHVGATPRQYQHAGSVFV